MRHLAKQMALAAALTFACGAAYAQQQAPAAAAAQPAPTTAVSFVALNVTDMDKSIAFYKLVGFNVSMSVGKAPQRSTVFNMGPTSGGLILVEHAGPIEMGTGLSRVGLRTGDAAGLCKRLAEAGYPCPREPKANPMEAGAIVGFAKDPDGYALEIIQMPAAAK